LDRWIEGTEPAQAETELVKELAVGSGFYTALVRSQAPLLREHLLYYHAIEKRRSQLVSIKQSFWDKKLLPFVQGKEYLIKGMFPKWKDLNIPIDIVVSRVHCEEEHEITEHVKKYITEKCKGKLSAPIFCNRKIR